MSGGVSVQEGPDIPTTNVESDPIICVPSLVLILFIVPPAFIEPPSAAGDQPVLFLTDNF